MTTDTPLHLSPIPEVVHMPETVFVYVEKRGPFITQAPVAWYEFWTKAATGELDKSLITCMAGLSRIDPTQEGDKAFIYQAGILTSSLPDPFPAGLQHRTLKPGMYASFLMTGSYTQFPQAYPAAFERVAMAQLHVRPDFCMERYLNSPQDTAEENLKTEILVPITSVD